MRFIHSLSVLAHATSAICLSIPSLAVSDDQSNAIEQSIPGLSDDMASTHNVSSLDKRANFNAIGWKPAPWHLQVLSASRKLPTPVEDGAGSYVMIPDAGSGVDVYLMDSGIRRSHVAFKGRDVRNFGVDSDDDKSPFCDDGDMRDQFGHGTALAGLIVGHSYGAAPGATLYNVKINCTGAGVQRYTEAIKRITIEHQRKVAGGDPEFRGSVINMSFKIRDDSKFSEALLAASESGISIFASAGNLGRDVGEYGQYPCQYEWVTCVGAIDANYEKPPWSNYGDKAYINLVAPGDYVRTAYHESDTQDFSTRGTSMASALTAAVAAIHTSWLGLANGQAKATVARNAMKGLISGFPAGNTEYLVQTGIRSAEKYPSYPFIGAGSTRAEGIQVANFMDYKLDAGIMKRQNEYIGFIPSIESDYETPGSGQPSHPSHLKSLAHPKWRVDFYPTSSGKSCTGKSFAFATGIGNTADGRGDSKCLHADPIHEDGSITGCVTAQNFNGHMCTLTLFTDSQCKQRIKYPNDALGYFGQIRANEHMSFGQITFKSWSVQC